MPIAKNIKYCRTRAKMTQQDFADAIGVTKSTVISWEGKKTAVPIPSAQRVADYFGIGFSEFCDYDIEKLDHQLKVGKVEFTPQEVQNLLMFRTLPEEIKQAFRYAIATEYKIHSKK